MDLNNAYIEEEFTAQCMYFLGVDNNYSLHTTGIFEISNCSIAISDGHNERCNEIVLIIQ